MFRTQSDLSPVTYLDFVLRLAYTAEIKEWDNRPHIQRIRRFTYYFAIKLDLPSQLAENLAIAAMLHDVGKVTTPTELLLKKGKYTQFEWQTMEHHTIDGALILANSSNDILRIGQNIARSHHERWDGGGYPDGLTGEKIPLEARICAIADIYDALTSPRPYKTRMEQDDAYNLIVNSSGTLLDPRLVSIFQNNYKEILKLQKANQTKPLGR